MTFVTKILFCHFFNSATYNNNKIFTAGVETEFYVISDKKAKLRLPKPRFANYPLLRTVNEAINLATEEKKVFDEMERIKDIRRIDIEKGKSPCVRTCTEVCYYGM